MLVADEDPFHVYGFVETNDLFQSLLPPGMLIQRINRPPGGGADAQVRANILAGFNEGQALVSYSGHGNVDVWTSASLFKSTDAATLTNLQNHNKLSFVVVMDCLNGYFQDPNLFSISEALLESPNGGAVAAFASSGLTIAQGQHEMGRELYAQLYGGAPMKLGDAIKLAKAATFDIDVKRTWIFFGDPSLNIR
jgi:peptidase C25-like protein